MMNSRANPNERGQFQVGSLCVILWSTLLGLSIHVHGQLRYTDDIYSPNYGRNYQHQNSPSRPMNYQSADQRSAWSGHQPQHQGQPAGMTMSRSMSNGFMLNNNNEPQSSGNGNQNSIFTQPKMIRHINYAAQQQNSPLAYQSNPAGLIQSVGPRLSNSTPAAISSAQMAGYSQANYCHDKLCYGLPNGCLEVAAKSDSSPLDFACSVLVTSKRMIDPVHPIKRDILFELYAKTDPSSDTYAAVGFSETGRMQGLVSACIHSDKKGDRLNVISLQHSYNVLGQYSNVPVNIKSGIKNLGVTVEDGTFQCRWIVQSSVEFNYELPNGTIMTTQADLGYRNFHVQLAQGAYDASLDLKMPHSQRSSSKTPVSLAQTGTIKSFGSHILLKIHGSIMIVVWIGLVTISIMLARYYKNEWVNNKLSNLALWFVLHRFLMLTAWFCSIMAVIFAYMYTETYHPGYHSISGTACLFLSTMQIIGGIFRPSQDSSKRVYFNWAHFVAGNLSYLLATSFLPSIQLPPVYIWVVALFVAFYALIHFIMTIHQFIIHKSSKISITPMGDLGHQPSHYADACGFVGDTYHKESNGVKQCMIGVLVTIVVIFIIVLVTLVNLN